MKKNKKILFSKYTGAGNDFIILENDSKELKEKKFIKSICNRNFGAGADGLFIIKNKQKGKFEWTFFNSDGSRAELCINAARCAIKYCYDKYRTKEIKLKTIIGEVQGKVLSENQVFLNVPYKITEPQKKILRIKGIKVEGYFVNTGVPHFVLETNKLKKKQIEFLNPLLRKLTTFHNKGMNVTQYQLKNKKIIAVSFERGVEGYTLACGSGAAAVASVILEKYKKQISTISMPGGNIKIALSKNSYYVWGPSREVFSGTFEI